MALRLRAWGKHRNLPKGSLGPYDARAPNPDHLSRALPVDREGRGYLDEAEGCGVG
jgi:hypothetical protein